MKRYLMFLLAILSVLCLNGRFLYAVEDYRGLLPSKSFLSLGIAYHNGVDTSYKYNGDTADLSKEGQISTVDIDDDAPEKNYSAGNGYNIRLDWGAQRYLHLFDRNIPFYGFGIFGEYRSITGGFVPYSGAGGGVMVSLSLLSMRIGYGKIIYIDDSNLEKFSRYEVPDGSSTRKEVYESMSADGAFVLFSFEIDIPLSEHLHPYIGIDTTSFEVGGDDDFLYSTSSYFGARYLF